MNFDDPDVRRVLRKKALQEAVAWGKQINSTLSGEACFHLGALVNTAQSVIREEFGEDAYRETFMGPGGGTATGAAVGGNGKAK